MRVLFFTKNWIGDVIFAEPLMRVVKQSASDNYIICVCPPRCRSFLEKNPYVDEVITFDEKGNDRSFFAPFRFMRMLRTQKIDRVYLLHRSFSRAFMCMLAGIKERIGYDTKGRGCLLTTPYHCDDKTRGQQHDVDYFLRLAGDIDDVAEVEKEYRFYFSQDDTDHITDLLKKAHIEDSAFVVLNPGANWIPKRWPVEYFARFADLFYERFSLPLVIAGNQANQALADTIIQCVNHDKCVSLCGKTTLTQAGALFARSIFVLTADSGPMHIASGVGAAVVALFGPTNHVRTGPRGIGEKVVLHNPDIECIIPCYEKNCATFTCMSNITPEMVMEKVGTIMADRL